MKQPSSPSLLRRFRGPIILAIIACIVVVFATRYEHQRQQRMEAFVSALVSDVAADRDLSARMANTQPLIGQRAVAQIRSILAENPFAADVMRIEVVSGDPSAATSGSPSPASHTAILQIDTIELMRLGLIDRGRDTVPEIVSYSVPGN